MNELPMVMLGIRTAWREDINCSPAQLVYGTDLHLPGEFFEAQRTSTIPPGFLHELQETMRNIQPTPMTYYDKQPTHRGIRSKRPLDQNGLNQNGLYGNGPLPKRPLPKTASN